jgi:Fe-S-cluster containining protein
MNKFTLRSFKLRIRHRKSSFISFLTRVKRKLPRHIDSIVAKNEAIIWHEVDCLSCANCCKTMTPTYTAKDIKRIAAYLDMPVAAMKEKWLKKERGSGDWVNKTTPCQFLDEKTNFCSVYEARPADCAGFPHLTKKKFTDFIHVHKQNLDSCPATFKLVERMMYEIEKK